MNKFVSITLSASAALAAALAAAIIFGGPGEPAPMASINDPFRHVDMSGLPAVRRFSARDGTALAYRHYAAATARGSVVLVHGSSASSVSLHTLARAFAAAGYDTFALDMRGHGESGRRGVIDHVGQLDEDVADFMQAVRPARPATLAGFSAGGGFTLRFAAGAQQALFDRYLLLSPFISQDAPSYRPDSGGWVSVGVPRIVALSLLDAIGVRSWQHLPVTRFALNEHAKALLTPSYSFALATNFRPRRDWRADIGAARQPMALLAGADDEAFHADRFEALFAGTKVPVTLLPGIDHVGLTLKPQAVAAAVAAVQRFDH